MWRSVIAEVLELQRLTEGEESGSSAGRGLRELISVNEDADFLALRNHAVGGCKNF
jgi:hypothetical protein